MKARASHVNQFVVGGSSCWLTLGCTLLLMQTGCSRTAHSSAGEPKKPSVRVSLPIQREVMEYAYFTGRTQAVDSINIQAQVTGYLDKPNFVEGSEVTAGQLLFQIDPRPYQATLDEALSQVKLAKARHELAIADYQRALNVAKTPGAISKQDIDKYAAAQSEASAAVEAAEANSKGAQQNLDFTRITSPINGRVGGYLWTKGNLVKKDTTLLTTVVSQDPMYVYFDVDEHTMLRVQQLIREGKVRSVRAGGKMPIDLGLSNEGQKYPHSGQIDFVNNQVDSSTGTLQVRATLENPAEGEQKSRLLSPGLFVRIRFGIGSPFKALLVPEAAVGTDQGRKYLLVVNDQQVVEYRPITLGPQQPGGLIVAFPILTAKTEKNGWQPIDATTPADAPRRDSLSPTDRVIIGNLQMVRADMPVEVREVPPAAAAPLEAATSAATTPAATTPMTTKPVTPAPTEKEPVKTESTEAQKPGEPEQSREPAADKPQPEAAAPAAE